MWKISVYRDDGLAVGKHISTLSSNKEVLMKRRTYVTKRWAEVDTTLHNEECHTNEEEPSRKRKNRKRNIIWFKLPFSKRVKTNIGGMLLKSCWTSTFLQEANFTKSSIKTMWRSATVAWETWALSSRLTTIRSPGGPKQSQNGATAEIKKNAIWVGSAYLQGLYIKQQSSQVQWKSVIGLAGNTFKERFNNHKKISQVTKIWKRNWLSGD